VLDLQCCAGLNSILHTCYVTKTQVVGTQVTDTGYFEQDIPVPMCVIGNTLGGLLRPKIAETDLSGCRDPSFPPIEVSSGQPFSCCQTSCRQHDMRHFDNSHSMDLADASLLTRKWMWALTHMTEVGWP